MTELPKLLESVPLLHELSAEHLRRLAGIVRRVSFREGDELVRIGDPGGSLIMVLEGTVRVLYPGQSSEFEMTRLGPGGHVGEMTLLNGQPRSATLRALDHVEVAVLDREAFREVAAETPGLALHILETLSVRMRGADEHISALSDMAMRDALTGLLNRRAFTDRMRQEADRARRYKSDFSLILFDIDRFKAVNDTLGHDVGDTVLQWLGRTLAEHTRASDSPFRIGGEEFAVLCPATGLDTAPVAARRLVELVGSTDPPVDGLRVTMCAGYASCPDHGSSFEELYRTADQALLAAKEAGPSRVGEPATAVEQPPAEE